MVERLVRDQEVASSNLVTPIFLNPSGPRACEGFFSAFDAEHSSGITNSEAAYLRRGDAFRFTGAGLATGVREKMGFGPCFFGSRWLAVAEMGAVMRLAVAVAQSMVNEAAGAAAGVALGAAEGSAAL